MKTMNVWMIACALLGSTFLFAGDPDASGKEKKGCPEMNPAAYDADRNGKLDAQELAKMKQEETKKIEDAYAKMKEQTEKKHEKALARLASLEEKLKKNDGDLKCCDRERRSRHDKNSAAAPAAPAAVPEKK